MSNYSYSGWQNRSHYKDKIRERDHHTCQLCGGHGHDVDHIVPWYISHDNSESNLRVLCHSCNLKGRRYTLPAGKTRQLPWDDWYRWLDAELAKC